jgi:nucleoside 2-deoxyribosyltransferase
MNKMEHLGFLPLFPNLDYSNEDMDIAFDLEEKTKLAREHFQAIEDADAIYFILPAGYMGTSCKIELGYALALEKPIYFSELTQDLGLDGYPKKIITIDNLSELINEFN